MNELQNCLLEIYNDVRNLCCKHQISLFLVEGTALGAYRHHGFIPWDDDLDVGMLRKDYERFREIALGDSEFCRKYFYQDYKTDPAYPIPFCKIRKNNTLFVEEGTENLPIHQGVYIDIFPLDYISSHKPIQFLQFYAAQLYEALLRKNTPHNPLKRVVIKLIHISHAERFSMNFFYSWMIHRGKKTHLLYSYYMSEMQLYPFSAFFPAAQQVFEGETVDVMNEIEFYLETRYGDYMTPPSREQQILDQHSKYYKLNTKE